MQYNDLLGKQWLQIDRNDRVQALGDAYVAGRKAAEEGLIEHGGTELLNDSRQLEECFSGMSF